MPMPERPDDLPEWKTADRISDRIVDIIGGFAFGVQQSDESLFEVRRARVEKDRHG